MFRASCKQPSVTVTDQYYDMRVGASTGGVEGVRTLQFLDRKGPGGSMILQRICYKRTAQGN